MNINLDKFWQFIKEWTVGRLIALLLLIGWIFFCDTQIKDINQKLFLTLLTLAILLEIYELSHNKLVRLCELVTSLDSDQFDKLKGVRITLIIIMILSICGLISLAFSFLFLL